MLEKSIWKLLILISISLDSFGYDEVLPVDTIFLPNLRITASKTQVKSGDTLIIKAELLEAQNTDVILSFKTFGDAIENIDYATDFFNKGQHTILGWTADHPSLSSDIGGRLFVDNKRNLYVGGAGITKWQYGDTTTTKIIDIGVTDFTVDTSGNIYVSDALQNTIFKYKPGHINPEIVAGGNGPGNLSNQLWYQWGVALDDSLNLFIADYFNNRIQKWQPNSLSGSTIIGGDIPGTSAKVLPFPKRIFIDKRGYLYVLDVDKITKWRLGYNQPILTIPRIHGITYYDTDAVFFQDNGDIIICDEQVHVFDSTGKKRGIIQGFDGRPLSLNPYPKQPTSIFIDFLGNHFYSDSYNFRIVMNQISPDIFIPAGQKSGFFKIRIQGSDSNSLSKSLYIKPLFAKNVQMDTSLIQPLSIKISCTTIIPTVKDISVCKGQKNIDLAITPSPNHQLLWYNSYYDNDSRSLIPPKVNTDTTGNIIYYVSQFDKISGCESKKNKFSVNIPENPKPPTVKDTSFCYGSNSMLKASAEIGNSLLWFRDISDTIGISQSSFSADPYILGTKAYYVSQVNSNKCISDKSAILVTIIKSPPAPITNDINLCFSSNPGPLKATADSGNILLWYDFLPFSPPSLSPIIPRTNSIGKSFYFVSQKDTITGCESSRSTINVNIVSLPTPPSLVDSKFCNGDTSAKFSISTGINNRVKWYLESGDSTQAPRASDLISGKYRFLISQVDSFGCESTKKEMLVDVIKRPNPPTADSVEFCYNGQSKALSATPSTNSILNWYGTNAIGGTKSSSPPIPSTQKEGVFNYYVSQLDSLSKCESDRSIVRVSINPIPSRPTIVRSNSMLLSSAPLGNQWLKNGELIAGATETSYKPIENGQYSLQVTIKNCTSPTAESYYFITTGLSNIDQIGRIKISPNPAKTQLFIESRETQLTGVTIEIYDLKGSLLMRKPRFKLNMSLDVGHLNNGVYLFVIKSNDSQIIYQTQLIKSQ